MGGEGKKKKLKMWRATRIRGYEYSQPGMGISQDESRGGGHAGAGVGGREQEMGGGSPGRWEVDGGEWGRSGSDLA